MSKLDELYSHIKGLEKFGIKLDGKTMKEVDDLEEQLIKDEILPALTKDIEPILSKIQRDFVLVIEYQPSKPISVALSRKNNVSQIIEAKKIEMDPEVAHSTHEMIVEPSHHGPASSLRIIFPNGETIEHKKAVDSLTEFVKKIGVDKIRQVVEQQNLKFCKVPVISNRLDKKYGKTQKDLGNGWFLITHSNNKMKKAFIEKISAALHLNVTVRLY